MRFGHQALRSQLGSVEREISLFDCDLRACFFLTLDKSSQDLATGLQQRMAHDNLEEFFQSGAPPLDDVVAEAVGEDLARQGRDGDARALALENVAKVLKVRVPSADAALAQLEGGDVGAAQDLVVGVHVPAHAVRARAAHLDLEEVLGRAVDLVEALLARVGHGLEDGPVEEPAGAGGGGGGGFGRLGVAAGTVAGILIGRQFCGVGEVSSEGGYRALGLRVGCWRLSSRSAPRSEEAPLDMVVGRWWGLWLPAKKREEGGDEPSEVGDEESINSTTAIHRDSK